MATETIDVKVPTAYACSSCERMFTTKQQLLVHQYIHKEKPNLTCAICSRTLPNEAAFRRHQRMHLRIAREREAAAEGGVRGKSHKRRRLCAQCNEPFNSRQELEDHHRKEHMADKLFACAKCDAHFSWPANLARHQRVHADPPVKKVERSVDNDKPYVCKICHKGFRFDFSYEAHLNAHEVAKETPQSAEGTTSVVAEATTVDSAGESRELIVQILNVPGEPMASSVTIDPESASAKSDNASTPSSEPALQYTVLKSKPSEAVDIVVMDDQAKGGKRRKRSPDPLLYDLTMTPEKPFVCEVCDMPFRWQISLYVHMREHFGMEPGVEMMRRGRSRPSVKKTVGRPRSKPQRSQSQIVQQRASSDEEDYTEEDYMVRRHGRGRFTSVKARGRETGVISVMRRGRGSHLPGVHEDWMLVDSSPVKGGDAQLAVKTEKNAKKLKAEKTVAGVTSTAATAAGDDKSTVDAAQIIQVIQVSNKPGVARVKRPHTRPAKLAVTKRRGGRPAKNLFAVWAAPVVAAHLQWQNRRTGDRRAFPCGACKHTLPTRALRDVHRMCHSARRQCAQCLRCFSNDSTAAIHRLSHPSAKSRHRCPLCAKQFRTVIAVKAHVRAHAPAFIAHMCKACGRRFTKAESLRVHGADCTSVKTTHTCEVCHRVFTRKRFYELHRRSGCIFGAFDDDTSTTL